MTPVEERLRRRIAFAGPISVAEYMAACLTDPDGYYSRLEPFGAAGDFVTAPEISQHVGSDGVSASAMTNALQLAAARHAAQHSARV